MKPRDGPAADDGETTMARLNLQPTLIGRKPTDEEVAAGATAEGAAPEKK